MVTKLLKNDLPGTVPVVIRWPGHPDATVRGSISLLDDSAARDLSRGCLLALEALRWSFMVSGYIERWSIHVADLEVELAPDAVPAPQHVRAFYERVITAWRAATARQRDLREQYAREQEAEQAARRKREAAERGASRSVCGHVLTGERGRNRELLGLPPLLCALEPGHDDFHEATIVIDGLGARRISWSDDGGAPMSEDEAQSMRFARAAAAQRPIPPKCDAIDAASKKRCALVNGHDGRHFAQWIEPGMGVFSANWSDEALAAVEGDEHDT